MQQGHSLCPCCTYSAIYSGAFFIRSPLTCKFCLTLFSTFSFTSTTLQKSTSDKIITFSKSRYSLMKLTSHSHRITHLCTDKTLGTSAYTSCRSAIESERLTRRHTHGISPTTSKLIKVTSPNGNVWLRQQNTVAISVQTHSTYIQLYSLCA